jgi:Rieske Fe-S protein
LNPDEMPDEPQLPSPTLWPIGFAIGIAVLLVGLIVDPLLISPIGAGIAIVFGFFWVREASSELRAQPVAIEPEHRDPSAAPASAVAHETPSQRFPRSKFLEGTTIGLGAVVGGMITVPVAGFALLPPFIGQKRHTVDLGLVTDYADGQWYISTFVLDPSEGEVSRRTAFIRNNGTVTVKSTAVPSFTIISNHCAHLGCPVQANGPSGAILGLKTLTETGKNGKVTLLPVVPAGFGCPCHGGQYDTEGNRTAGPPTHALDRYEFEIDNGRLVLLSPYSVSHIDGTGAQAKIHKYKEVGPGEHLDGIEQILYPLNPPHH